LLFQDEIFLCSTWMRYSESVKHYLLLLLLSCSISEATVGNDDEILSIFKEWCVQQNIEAPKLEIVWVEGFGRGVVATEDIQVKNNLLVLILYY
jgi:hypothetical protein